MIKLNPIMDNKRKKVSFSGKPQIKIIESRPQESTSSLSMELTLDLTQTQNTVTLNKPSLQNQSLTQTYTDVKTKFFNASFDDESDHNANVGTLSEENKNICQKDVFEQLLDNASTVEEFDFNSPLVDIDSNRTEEISIARENTVIKNSKYEIEDQIYNSLNLTGTINELNVCDQNKTEDLNCIQNTTKENQSANAITKKIINDGNQSKEDETSNVQNITEISKGANKTEEVALKNYKTQNITELLQSQNKTEEVLLKSIKPQIMDEIAKRQNNTTEIFKNKYNFKNSEKNNYLDLRKYSEEITAKGPNHEKIDNDEASVLQNYTSEKTAHDFNHQKNNQSKKIDLCNSEFQSNNTRDFSYRQNNTESGFGSTLSFQPTYYSKINNNTATIQRNSNINSQTNFKIIKPSEDNNFYNSQHNITTEIPLHNDSKANNQINSQNEKNTTNIMTTLDIEELIKENTPNLNDFLLTNNIIFHDNINLPEQKKLSMLPVCKINKEECFYDSYVTSNQLEYNIRLNLFLKDEFQRMNNRIKDLGPQNHLQNDKIDPRELRHYARNKAKNEWYQLCLEKEEENIAELKMIKEKINILNSEEHNIENELNAIEDENKMTELKINQISNITVEKTNEDVQEKIDIIKNYFLSKINFKDKLNNLEGNFIFKQLTYDELKKEDSTEIVNLLETEIESTKTRNSILLSKKEKYELKIDELEHKIKDCEDKYKILHATKEECEDVVNKYKLLLKMFDIENERISEQQIILKILDFKVSIGKIYKVEVIKNNSDVYDFFLKNIEHRGLKDLIYYLFELKSIRKEINGHQIYLNEDSVEIYVKDKVVSFNIDNIIVSKNDTVLFSGLRKYGMIEGFLKSD